MCSLGLHDTERDAWIAAEEHVYASLRDLHTVRRIVREEIEAEIDKPEATLLHVRSMKGREPLPPVHSRPCSHWPRAPERAGRKSP